MTLALAVLLLAAALAVPATRRLGAAAALVLPLPLLFVLALLLSSAPAVLGGEVPRELLAVIEPLGAQFALRLDGLGLLFGVLVGIIGSLVLVHAAGYFADEPGLLGRFSAYAYLFAAAMLGLVLADDLFLLFICWELTSVCSFLLIGLKHEQSQAREGAQRALLVTGAGGIALLVGLLLLVAAAGTSSIGELVQRGETVRDSALYMPALCLVLLGAFTKSAQVPFHYWLPGAMAAPGPVSAFLHSATLVKAGVFLLARLHPVLGFTVEWHVLLGHVGALTMLVGALLAFAQSDLKRMLAFTTVAGLGTIVMLLGIGTEPALRAALLFVAVHALYKASLFLVVGYLDQRTGTRELSRLRGLARLTPLAFVAALLAALSMSGLPPLLGAIAKELVYEAKLGAPEAPRLLAAVGSLANAAVIACALLVGLWPFLRRGVAPDLRPVAGRRLLLGPLVLSLLGLLLGLFHDTYARPWIDAALGVAQGEPVTAEYLLDASPDAVGWLSKGTLLTGVLIFALRRRLLTACAGLSRLARLGPSVAHERLLSGVFALGAALSALAARRVVRRSLLVSLALLVAAGGYLLFAEPSALRVPSLSLELHQAFLVLLVAAGALATVRARDTLRAVTALGVAGFGVGMLFLDLGGPDLASTQIAVETLAVLLLLSVLRRAPMDGQTSARNSGAWDSWLALAVGATFTLLVWAAAPDGSLRPLAARMAEASVPLGFGRNVVNVILVDFRALDTLGEVFVLAIASLGVSALLRSEGTPRRVALPAPGDFGASPILRAAARSLVPLLALLSIVLFVRGHQEPGGGFVGGLVAAAAAVLHAFAFGVETTRARLASGRLTAFGLGLALLAGGIGLLAGEAFLAGQWLPWQVPAVGKLGTPLLFDAGVFLVVLGVSTRVLFELLVREERT